MPITAFVNTFSSFLGPILDSYIHIKYLSFCAFFIISIACASINYYTNIYRIYFAMFLMGLASGISLIPLTRNSWLYFPKHRGLISGLILFGYGFSSLIFTSIADALINPNYVSIDPETNLFNDEITNNTQSFLRIFTSCLSILAFIGFLLIFEYQDKEKETKVDQTETKQLKEKEDIEEIEVKHPLRQAYTSPQVWQMIIMNFCVLIFCFTCSNTYRTFGQINLIDEKLLSVLSKIFALLNGSGRLFWGILFDRFSFKCLYSLIVITEIAISATLYYAVKIPYLYLFLVSIQSLVLAGNVSLLVPLYPKIFGMKYSTIIFAVACLISGTNSLVTPTLSKLILHNNEDYRTLFWVGTGFALVSFTILLFFKEKKFKFIPDKDEKEKELVDQSPETQEI